MIKENKASRYLLYAIGEIVLVVIGILIALQLNTWNQNRLDRNEEALLLGAIAKKMDHNRFQHQRGLKRYSEVVNGARVLIKLSGKPIHDSLKIDIEQSLFDIKNRFLMGKSNQISVYDELIASGKLNLLRSAYLRQELTKLKANLQLLAAYEDQQNNFVDNHLSPALNREIDYIAITNSAVNNDGINEVEDFDYKPLSANANDYTKLLQDRTILNLLAELVTHTNTLLPIYHRMGENIQRIDSIVKPSF
ncbi:DUF6090 family protein [Muriicola sp.]|uniref:DUF6090 family protein n=1 Tax=Muriicola sp. TaxID=2020856 RepID=UPI003C790F0D